jgi:hypothetical protein
MYPMLQPAFVVLFTGLLAGPAAGDLERRFEATVHPFLETYCFTCHGEDKQEGKLRLSSYTSTAAVVRDLQRWELVRERLQEEDMPPPKAKRHPSVEERRAVIDWLHALRRREMVRNAGDPGVVLARRLSNAEYDCTIRDLTGVDIRPTREFPVDPANEAGFDNSGESLRMSPTLLKKYLTAARHVADHIALTPTGFTFAPYPVVTEQSRDKYCVQRIVDFYKRQRTDYADYFLAAWRFRHRDPLGQPAATLADFATAEGISASYLTRIWSILTGARHEIDPLATLQALWRDLPAPDTQQQEAKQADAARAGCMRMRDFVINERQQFKAPDRNIGVYGISTASQSLILWKNRRLAENRMRYHREPSESSSEDPAARQRRQASLALFCATFPDAFYVSERGQMHLDADQQNKGRLLSAGFHLMGGYFRDDAPLYELILDASRQRELDRLWQELDFITLAPLRQYRDFVFFERAEPLWFMQEAVFDFVRAEQSDVTAAAKIRRLAEVYLDKARKNQPDPRHEPSAFNSGRHGGTEDAIEAIERYFTDISAAIQGVEKARLEAEPRNLEALGDFAERAYRRPLADAERDELLAFYRSLRAGGLDHEDAIGDAVVRVLMSPYFCYRIDSDNIDSSRNERHGTDPARSGASVQPLSDYSVASRLSYFLWSSLPDRELLEHAASGDLRDPEVLLAQCRRMLLDPRIRGLATEFGGNWLDFRRFEGHSGVDRDRFTAFTDELRQAMYEEPLRFLVDLIQRDASVLDVLYGEHTFVNATLAAHYGLPQGNVGPDAWVRVDSVGSYGRGGLLPMAVFLTQNSPGLRTSPVKRGYWVVRRLLGKRIPPPPPDVPELPADEAKMGDLTLRQLLAKHRETQGCAACHDHFDALGLVFEGYGPIGDRRTTDFSGRPVDTRATFPGGSEGTGLDGLRHYLREHRQEEYVDNLCRKLLAYALGRGLLVSDEATVSDMRARLAATGYRFGTLVEVIVTSRQFLNKRMREE